MGVIILRNKIYSMRSKNILITIFVLMLVLSGNAFAASLDNNTKAVSDVGNHWANKQITEWVNKGLAQGYNNGTFRPENTITRAEFITLLNRAIGLIELGEVGFVDVLEENWFHHEVGKAIKSGYISGYQDNTMRPNNHISRQEVAVILSRLMKLDASNIENVSNKFADKNSIPGWSRSAINSVVSNGLMDGYPDQTYRPDRFITRAEAVVVLDRALGVILNNAGEIGPENSVTTINGNVTITASDNNLMNTIISGNLYITEGVGEGNVRLENVTVMGTTLIQGGGIDSIYVNNSVLGTTIVDKLNGKIRIVASGNTVIGETTLYTGAKLEESNLVGTGFTNVNISPNAPENVLIQLAGDMEKVNVAAVNSNIEVLRGTISQFVVSEGTNGSTLVVSSGAKISILELNSAAAVSGNGKIESAVVNAPGTSFMQFPDKITLAAGIITKVDNKEISDSTETNNYVPEETASGGSSGSSRGGSRGGSTVEEVTNIIINEQELDLNVGENYTLTIDITPANATNKNVTWASNSESVATVSQDGRITAVGQGIATITATTSNGKSAISTITVSDPNVAAAPEIIINGLDSFKEMMEKEFSVATIANDFSGINVRVEFILTKENSELNGDEVVLSYKEVSMEDNPYLPLNLVPIDGSLTGTFGPSSGFPLGDITSNFKATFAMGSAGKYTLQMSIITIDEEETLASFSTNFDVLQMVKPVIVGDGLDDFEETVEKSFSVSTIANDCIEMLVLGTFEITRLDGELQGNEVSILYEEVKTGEYLPLPLVLQDDKLTGSFGPPNGFPLTNATSNFKATFAEGSVGDYKANINIIHPDSEKIVTQVTFDITVREKVYNQNQSSQSSSINEEVDEEQNSEIGEPMGIDEPQNELDNGSEDDEQNIVDNDLNEEETQEDEEDSHLEYN